MEGYLKRHGQLWLVVVCTASFLLTWLAPVDASFSDPCGALLTAQAIVDHGRIRLDVYARDGRLDFGEVRPAASGHLYDYFPLGTALAAVPAVWLARLRGEDMVYREDNRALQNTLSSLTVAACALLISAVCRLYLPLAASVALTAVFVFGSSVVSTLGTALWSSNLALLLGLASLLVLARYDRGGGDRPPQAALGLLTFAATLCRPTMALLALVTVAYLAWRRRRPPWTLLAVLVVGFALFAVFSRLEYGTLLPPYYQPSRLGHGRFWTALFGHLASPSRGVLVGSPYLLLSLAGLLAWRRRIGSEPLAWLAGSWILLLWLVVSSFPDWWGGWSFGNRLFAEAIPAFLLLTVLVTAAASERLSPRGRRLAGAAFLATAAFAVFVHSHQGLYNVYSILWCEGIERDPSRVFDWRRPQFLASPRMLEMRGRVHRLLEMPAVASGEEVLPTSESVVFEGWSVPEGDGRWRWSKSRRPKVLLRADAMLAGARELVLEIEAGTYRPQVIAVRLNGAAVGELRSERHWKPTTYRLTVPAAAVEAAWRPLPEARIFELEFDVPGAVLVRDGPKQRRLGICLWRLALRAAPG